VVMATSAIHKKRVLQSNEVGPLDALGETTATFCGARSRTVAQLDDNAHPRADVAQAERVMLADHW
jgi:hypothetical protein